MVITVVWGWLFPFSYRICKCTAVGLFYFCCITSHSGLPCGTRARISQECKLSCIYLVGNLAEKHIMAGGNEITNEILTSGGLKNPVAVLFSRGLFVVCKGTEVICRLCDCTRCSLPHIKVFREAGKYTALRETSGWAPRVVDTGQYLHPCYPGITHFREKKDTGYQISYLFPIYVSLISILVHSMQ